MAALSPSFTLFFGSFFGILNLFCFATLLGTQKGPDKGNGEVEKVLKETQKQAEKAKEKVEAVPLACQ